MHALYEGVSRDTHNGCHTSTKYTKALHGDVSRDTHNMSRDTHNGWHTSTKYTKALYVFCLGVSRDTHNGCHTTIYKSKKLSTSFKIIFKIFIYINQKLKTKTLPNSPLISSKNFFKWNGCNYTTISTTIFPWCPCNLFGLKKNEKKWDFSTFVWINNYVTNDQKEEKWAHKKLRWEIKKYSVQKI